MLQAIKIQVLLVLGLLFLNVGKAQIVHDSELVNSSPIKFAALLTQNDLYKFGPRSDKYFTNGLHIQYANKFTNNIVAQKVLLNFLKESNSQYAVSFGQDIYTPLNLYIVSVDSNDIPYSGTLYFTYARQSNNHRKGIKLVSKLYLGVQGPASGAGEMQFWYHEITNYPLPKGWGSQIQNGLVLDYEVKYQRLLPVSWEFMEVSTHAKAHVGTLQNFVQAGIGMKLGLFNYSYTGFDGLPNASVKSGRYSTKDIRWSKKRKAENPENAVIRNTHINSTWQVYGFASVDAGVMFYDGTVQGSLVPFESSPFLFSYYDYDKNNGSFKYGFTINYKNFVFQASQVIKRDVYKGSGTYGWGEVKVALSF